MTNAKDKHEKQEELKSCPVAAALGARPRGRGALPRVRLTRRGGGVGAARQLLGVASEPAAMRASSPRPVAATVA